MNNSKAKGKKAAAPKKAAPTEAESVETELIPPPRQVSKEQNAESAEQMQAFRDEAWQLEIELEMLLLRDAVYTARLAIQELHAETYNGQPYERRKGLRIKEKALKVDYAFNRLRALRKGDLLPPRHEDEW